MQRTRKSKAITQAEARIAALRPIESKLDFGKSLSLPIYIAKTDETRNRLANLNTLVAQIDSARNSFETSERELVVMSIRILKAVLVQFGPDSVEYAMAGGTRTRDRKRSPRRAESGASAPSNNPSTQDS